MSNVAPNVNTSIGGTLEQVKQSVICATGNSLARNSLSPHIREFRLWQQTQPWVTGIRATEGCISPVARDNIDPFFENGKCDPGNGREVATYRPQRE